MDGLGPPGLSSTNSFNVIISHAKRIFIPCGFSIGGGTSCPMHRNGAAAGFSYTPAKNAKKGGVTLKLCINHEEKTCENSDYLPKMERKSGEKLYCVANAYIQILFSGK